MLELDQIFEEVVKQGIEYSTHESDLYIPVNDQTRALIKQYKYGANVTTFTNQVTGTLYYDVSFGYTPWWDEKAKIVEGWARAVS